MLDLPGELVAVGASRLHVVAEGQGTPVLLTAGLGGGWFEWDGVAARLRDRYRVIRFDRPGLGLSPPASVPPSLAGEAARLAALATSAGPPVVAVAHSVAGFHAEAFARLFPDKVAGMVLVDPSYERDARRPRVPGAGIAAALTAAGRAVARRRSGRWIAERLGPWAYEMILRQVALHPERVSRELIRTLYGRAPVMGALLAEYAVYRTMAADLARLRRTHPFPPIPLTVLTADASDRWRENHHRIAAMSPHGRQLVFPEKKHMLHLDNPEVVAQAVIGV